MPTKSITVAPAEGTWVVRVAGAVIGESTEALELHERDRAPVIYFPRKDVEMAFLDESDTVTNDPTLGKATHYSIVAKSGVVPDVVWSYEDPGEDVERIRNHLAFYVGDKVAVEQL